MSMAAFALRLHNVAKSIATKLTPSVFPQYVKEFNDMICALPLSCLVVVLTLRVHVSKSKRLPVILPFPLCRVLLHYVRYRQSKSIYILTLLTMQ
jgi:hypothetical protein